MSGRSGMIRCDWGLYRESAGGGEEEEEKAEQAVRGVGWREGEVW